ncbi:MAG TPA: PQQ-binding-like beta-propeller repeat protein [Armatimonadota bacterium]|jgi:hypothetical protein
MRYLIAVAAVFVTLIVRAHSQQVKIDVSGELTGATVCDGVVYFGSFGGKLYAVRASDGTTMPGFPVDIAVAVGDGSYPRIRPGVYYGSLGKAVYLETSKHGVVKVWPDGAVAWINRLDGSSVYFASAAPAVTPQGEVIAEMKTLQNIFLVKLKETDGTVICTSPPLSMVPSDYVSPPAVAGGNVYITVVDYPAAGGSKYITVLNLADLTVKAAVSGSAYYGSTPYVRGNGIFYGSSGMFGELVFKLNSVTLNPDQQFGAGLSPGIPGVTRVTPQGSSPAGAGVFASPVSADRDPGGTVYAAIGNNMQGTVVAIDAATGKVRTLYATGNQGGGMVVSTKNVIAYCDGKTLQTFGVDGGHYGSFTLPGYPSGPCYDPTTNRFFVTTQPDTTGTSYLLGFDSP